MRKNKSMKVKCVSIREKCQSRLNLMRYILSNQIEFGMIESYVSGFCNGVKLIIEALGG